MLYRDRARTLSSTITTATSLFATGSPRWSWTSIATFVVPPGASCYLFSDGVFEIIDKNGTQWAVDNFVELVLGAPIDGLTEPQRLFNAVRKRAISKSLEDDFSLVVVHFD